VTDVPPDFVRRKVLQMTGQGGAGLVATSLLSAASASAATAPSSAPIASSDSAADMEHTTADILVETLINWQVPFVFGIVGDGINSIVEVLRKRQDRIRFIAVRHEEAAAFMACGYAKHTRRLGVCLATTGPGAIHLMNGLFDAKMDSAPVLAITGTTFHDLIGTHFMQGVDTVSLMQSVALYNVRVSGPLHARVVGNLACRAALAGRGVAHLTVAKDIQAMRLAQDKPSIENHGLRTDGRWMASQDAPSEARLREAADILNQGHKIAILVGQGALDARFEVIQVAERLGAPVAKALLGKGVLPDDSPYTTGGIGHLGTLPSHQIMQECDTLLILGSTMPWVNYYPKPGQARTIQVDLNGGHIGLRCPVDVGLVSDVKATLTALLPMLQAKTDRGFLSEAQRRMRDWNALLARVAATERTPLRPQMVLRTLSDQLAPDAVISLDCGANTHFAARMIQLREGQQLTGTGMLATMAPGLPYAIAAQLAFPKRQCVAVVGDGGFSQLMAELATAVKYELPVKIIILKNNSLAEVLFEEQELGNPPYGCDLSPIDFAGFAKNCGAEGFRCAEPAAVTSAIRQTLQSSGPAVLEATVDANEKPSLPEELAV
jgi:pyruvate dehydrogenase (quinone)/pyruvate decarboxylase